MNSKMSLLRAQASLTQSLLSRLETLAGAGVAIACVTLAQACVIPLKAPEKAPFSQGAPVVSPAGAPGSQGGTAAPAAPTAVATAPKANISGPSAVVVGDVFTPSASTSDAGGGTLAYAWTLGAGFAFYPDEASQKNLAAPQIKALTAQMTTSISVSVTNAAGSNSASLAMKIIAETKLESKGGTFSGMTASAGGDIAIYGDNVSVNGTDFSFSLPARPSRVLVLDLTSKLGPNSVFNNVDLCNHIQKIDPTFNIVCDAANTPNLYDAVELKLSGTTTLDAISIDLTAFYNQNTGLNIREFRVSSDITATMAGGIQITAYDVVVDGDLKTTAGPISLTAPNGSTRGTGSVFVTQPLVTQGSNVTIRAWNQVVVAADVTTNSLGATQAGAVFLEGPGAATGPQRVVLLGSIIANAPGGNANTGGDITIGSSGYPVKDILFPLLRTIDVSGGVGAAGAGNAGGSGGTVLVQAKPTVDGNATVDLSNVLINADGGNQVSGNGVGNAGGSANTTTAIDILAQATGSFDATVIVGKAGTTDAVIHANGGEGVSDGGDGGLIRIRASAPGKSSVVGLGGATTSNGGKNNNSTTTPTGLAAGDGKEVRLRADGTGSNRISWNGNLVSVGGDSRIFPYVNPTAGAIGAPGGIGKITVKTASGTSGEISVVGDLVARFGKGAYAGAVNGCAGTEAVEVNAAASQTGSVRIAGTVDVRGGLEANGTKYDATTSHMTAGSNTFVGTTAGYVTIKSSGTSNASINVQNVTSVGGEGDGGGNGCAVSLEASSNGGTESIVYNTIDTSGGRANKAFKAGDGGAIKLLGAITATTSAAFQVAGGALTSNGGTHTGVAAAAGSAGGGAAGSIYISAAPGTANTDTKTATIIDVNTGALSAAGGTVSGRADVARTAGSGAAINVLLGSDASASTQLVTGAINAGGASGMASGGTAGINGGAGGSFVLTVLGVAAKTLADVTTGTIEVSGGSAVANSGGMMQTPGGAAGTATLNAKSPGKYVFGAITANAGNGNSGAAGGSVALTTESGEVSNVTFANIAANGGNESAATGGAGGSIHFTIPTPITITTGALAVNAGSGTANKGGGGRIYHTGTPTVGYIGITCSGTPGLDANMGGVMTGDVPCIDAVFSCSTGARICGSGSTSP